MFEIEISNEQSALTVDHEKIRLAIERILDDAGIESAEISVALVDDPTIHRLNRLHLAHDYPTDVLSFVLEKCDATLDGEVIVSTDTAISRADEFGQSAELELLLYVIHGMLHLVGFDDKNVSAKKVMRKMEGRYMRQFTEKFDQHQI